ncbi:MAG TPA: hypothetical protein VJ970_02800 [Flavobacteriaceae bacterium]|nr:hypothetical protein [Flavobacteriaceae bacterium]
MSIFEITNINSKWKMMKKSSLTTEVSYTSKKPAISVLFETENTKEIRIVMKADQAMKQHKTPYPITVEIFEGIVNFGVENDTYQLVKGDVVALEGNIPHDLKAIENSIIRLSLSKQDSVNRVKEVSKR